MIVSFKDADTEALAGGRRVRRLVNIEAVARRKLRQLHIAGRLDDLRVPPGNRLEALKGGPAGQHSIRVVFVNPIVDHRDARKVDHPSLSLTLVS